MRTKVPNRRLSMTGKIEHADQHYLITYGFDNEGVIREVFCADPRVGSDIHALLTDGCILISLYLQTGGEIERLVTTLGENRPEKADRGPPSSLLGAIARGILEVQKVVDAIP